MPSGIELSAGILVGTNKPVDAKFGPYPNTAAALADISATLRYKGLTVGIEVGGVITEYWFGGGIANSDFVAKVPTSSTGNITGLDTALAAKADLVNGKVPSTQLPSYVDDVVEYPTYEDFPGVGATPGTGESGKIYVALDTLKTYRWGTSAYAEISSSEVTSVAGHVGAVTLEVSDITGLETALDNKQVKTVFSATAPTVYIDGMRWVDTTTLTAYERYSNAWVEIVD
jgi:hypothetical protein